MTKIKTIKLQGKNYAPVSERLKAFREENPKGSIETVIEEMGNNIKVRATVTLEAGNEKSAFANGHSFGDIKKQKSFEKLESTAVGRALAFLGYMADGEIASSDEMEEYLSYKKNKIEEAKEVLRDCETLDELKKEFLSLGSLMSEEEIIKLKDELKNNLE